MLQRVTLALIIGFCERPTSLPERRRACERVHVVVWTWLVLLRHLLIIISIQLSHANGFDAGALPTTAITLLRSPRPCTPSTIDTSPSISLLRRHIISNQRGFLRGWLLASVLGFLIILAVDLLEILEVCELGEGLSLVFFDLL